MKNLLNINEYLTEKRVTVKRRYTENYPAKYASTSAKIRNALFDAMADGVLTEEELLKVLSEINANKRWLGRNLSLFNINEDQDGVKRYSLSKFGQRVCNATRPLTEGLNVPHKERGKKPVNIFVGRFQPFTLGHVKVFEQMYKKNGLPVVVFLVRGGKPDPEKRPFDEDLQQAMFSEMTKQYPFLEAAFVVPNGGIDTLFAAARPAYEPMMWGYGTDRKKAYDGMINKPEYREDLGVDPDFTGFEIKRTDDDVSASKVRNALMIDDEKTFNRMTPKSIHKFYKTLQDILEPIKENKKHNNMKNLKSLNEFVNESVNESPNETEVNEGSKIDFVTITNDLFQADPNWWVKNKLKVSNAISKALAGCKTKHVVIDIDKVHESVNESKHDFMARYGSTNINLKKGYKHHTEDELNDLYDKLGDLVKKLKVKDVTLVFESNINESEELTERKGETGLYVYPYTDADFKRLEKWLKRSDYHAEVDEPRGYVFFPEEKDMYDSLEMELEKEFAKNKISAGFEGE